MENLIDLQPLADVANNLIDKLGSAVGWIATHDTPYRTAIDTYIQEIQSSNYDPLTKAALISKSRKTLKEYCNQQDIVRIAINSMKPHAAPNSVDSDWLAQFMDKARLVSDAEFQILWGNILAEECNAPGSIPRVLLHSMEQMDKSMAEAFVSVASTSIHILDSGELSYAPMVMDSELKGIYEEIGITYDSLVNLQSIGLIEINFGAFSGNYVVRCTTTPIVVHYHESTYQFPDTINQVPVGHVIYTKAGEALCKSIFPNKIESFLESNCIPFWDKRLSEFKDQLQNE